MENSNDRQLNTLKTQLLKLLLKLNNLCRENSIDMFLCGETALAAYRDGVLSDRVNVAIDAKHADAFIKAIESDPAYNKSIILESLLNNSKYPTLELRYCNLETVDFNIRDFRKYKNNCIHVTVSFIQHVPKLRIGYGLARICFKIYRRLIKKTNIVSKTAISAFLFKFMLRTASSNSEQVLLNNKTFKSSMFNSSTSVTLGGSTFAIPGKGEDYLAREFGKKWELHKCYEYVENLEKFTSSAIAWKDYKKTLKGIDFKSYDKAREEYTKINEQFKASNVDIIKCYDVLERTFDRIYLYQLYSPRKEHILMLAKAGNYDELRDELREYIQFINKHYARGLGLCFDKDILDVTIELLKRDKGSEFAEEIRSLVPQQHYERIRLKDYKGNYIE